MFDILGFKNIINKTDDELQRLILTDRLDSLFRHAEEEIQETERYTDDEVKLEYIVFSDTIVLLAPDKEPGTYAWFSIAAKSIISESIYERLPLQGAISVGKSYTSSSHTMFLGSAFVEAYEYCDAQNWIGLLITPSASKELEKHEISPMYDDFRRHDIPWRKNAPTGYDAENTYAYRFQNDADSFKSQIVGRLLELQQLAPNERAKCKYDHTIKFIEKHYKTI